MDVPVFGNPDARFFCRILEVPFREWMSLLNRVMLFVFHQTMTKIDNYGEKQNKNERRIKIMNLNHL